MLISHRKKFIYTKTVKTAGTSVESYFERYCMPEGEWQFSHGRKEYVSPYGIIGFRGGDRKDAVWRGHMAAQEIKHRIGDAVWDDYFKFCVIRNPYEKLVSGFYFFHKQKDHATKTQSIKHRIAKLFAKQKPSSATANERDIASFRAWIKSGGWLNDRDKYLIDNRLCMDFFILYEDLENGIRHVCERLQIPFEPDRIPRLKTGHRARHLSVGDFYDAETAAIVSKRYAFELRHFGYEAPDSRRPMIQTVSDRTPKVD